MTLLSSKRIFNNLFLRRMCSVCAGSRDPHIPVMLNEAVEYLKPGEKQTILDMTFGAGGHSRKLLESAPQIKILALDRDPTAYNYALTLSKEYPDQVIPLLGKFSDLPKLLNTHKFGKNSIDGILMDCGCSSMQFDNEERGFSISKNGPLDMRMDSNRCENVPTAADVLAKASEGDLYKILKIYGEEKQAKKIARTIVEARYLFKKLQTTEELADLVDSCFTSEYRLDKLQRRSHNATKTFQAIRIFVNNELNELNYGMILAHHYLKLGGRLITITFHSLEDTIVKRHLMGNLVENTANPIPLKFCSHMVNAGEEMMKQLMEKNWKMLHKHVLTPTMEEVEKNPRSRSAKLRAAAKIN
ncbi:probable methyltransferase-like protein 15 homolog [Coccinella septempunctata]|uniref:probable methyltransferase-like protein 15 homolog n=1 Tax=Coccinella septempunctata TaxID=41139 RepID=UPI001D08AD40|nr:probable methyltransferase-like protein 15 homolog [Coccinella septempunctata]